jgi:hypothetical protein
MYGVWLVCALQGDQYNLGSLASECAIAAPYSLN